MKKEIKKVFLKKWATINESRIENEIYAGCMMLKNMSIVQKEHPMSTDYFLTELMDNAVVLKNIYIEIITDWRNGKGKESFDVMKEKIPLKQVKNYVLILEKLEKINPSELVPEMIAFEENFSNKRVTKSMRRTEKKSVITTLTSTAVIFAILMNFAIVVVFMDTLKMLGQVL